MKHHCFNLFLLFLLSFMFCGCNSTIKPRPVKKQIMLPAAIAGTSISESDLDSIRFGEQLKAYTVGRYIDPNNPDIMHEHNVIYRIEENSNWNTMPNEPLRLPFKKHQASRQQLINMQRPLTAELEAEIGRQKQLRKLLKQNNKSIRSTVDYSQQTNQQVGQIANTTQALNHKLAALEKQLQAMKLREVKNLTLIKKLLLSQNRLTSQLKMVIMQTSRQPMPPSQPEKLDFNLGFETLTGKPSNRSDNKPLFPKQTKLKKDRKDNKNR